MYDIGQFVKDQQYIIKEKKIKQYILSYRILTEETMILTFLVQVHRLCV